MPLRPLGTKVVVEPSEKEEKTAGGIVLPDTAKQKSIEGKVIAVGKGRTLDDGTVVPLSVSVGQTVIYSKYGGTEIKLEGKEYVVLDEDQIYAIKE
ncbi:MAG: co-chaperone GroES [Chthonomonadales bacterium]|nr:co-chaperone GroES [Chthonomonadales bacterium]